MALSMKRRGQLARDDSNAPVGWNYYFPSSTATTGNIALQPGVFHTLVLGTPIAGSIQFYDGASGATIANITTYATMANTSFDFDVIFSKGLSFVATAAENFTVSYISADK